MRQSTVSDIRKRAHNDALHHSVIIAAYPNNVSGVTNVYIRAWRIAGVSQKVKVPGIIFADRPDWKR